jgi:hypothetical protein
MKELIKTICVDKANFQHIGNTGIINGTLLLEIKRVMTEYTQQILTHKYNLSKENEKLKQRLIDNGLEKPSIIIDYSKNA